MFILISLLILIIYDSYTTRYRTWQIASTIAFIYVLTGLGSLFGLWLFGVITIPPS
jgi:uncharacterized membrane protein YqjE